MRLFVALVPPPSAVEHLDTFLDPRRDAADPSLRWSRHDQWHVTLAFAPDVPELLLDDLIERLARAARRRSPASWRIGGGGAFPHADGARVLWAGLAAADPPPDGADPRRELALLSAASRAAFVKAGAEVDGQRFRPHLTLARLRTPSNVTRWVRVLDSYAGPPWPGDSVSLIASHLGEGPRRTPRYEELARLDVGG